MELNRLETHDRFEYFTKSEFDISKTCQDIINQRPFGDHPFYLFAHKREIGTDERYSLWIQMGCTGSLSEVPNARILWQPRLTKPKPQENSMLFKGYPGTDLVKIIWIIPQRELWEQYEPGKMTGNQFIAESIEAFKNNKESLEKKEEDDLPDDVIQKVYQEIAKLKIQRVK